MTDSVTLPALGALVATDEIAGIHFARSKITLGAAGANDGDVSASNPMPVSTSNVLTRFREAFQTYTPGAVWAQTLGSGDIIALDGNAVAASYLDISKSPLHAGTVSSIASIETFQMPFDMAIGLGTSQRTLGQEFAIEAVSDEALLPAPADLAIASIQQVTTTLTVTTVLPHGLRPGTRIGIRDCADSRLNYPALVVATTPTATQFTVTAGPGGGLPSVTAGPLASGFVFQRSALGLAPNGTSMLLENATATNGSFYARSESGDVLPSAALTGNHSVAMLTTASFQAINAAAAYAFQPTNEFRLSQFADGVQWSDVAIDSLAAATNRRKITQIVPDPAARYRMRVRATNNASLTVPVAQIVSAVKTGTTTATITTDVPHGLTITDQIVVYGIRDQAAASFPNLPVATAVASVIDATTFTVVIGTAATVTSYGGYVARVNGGNLMSALGASAVVAQSIVRTGNLLTVTGNTTWAGLVIGDYVNLVGCRDNATGASLGIDGAYRVRDFATTTLVLEPISATVSPTGADIGLTNCGGAIIRRTSIRLSFVRVLDFERQRVELMPRPQGDLSAAAGVNVQGGTLASVAAVTTVSAVTAANLAIPGIIADVASAALAATTTTAAITPTFGTGYQVNIPVTAVSGTTPTLDVVIQESDDTGTNWFDVWHFPRITATGMYRSPVLPLTGNRIRYVQTVGGTTPSFTRAINRLQSSDSVDPIRQLFDRSLAPAQALNAVTASLTVQNCRNLQLLITAGVITTTAPALQLEGSDDNGLTWYAIGAPLTAADSATVQLAVAGVHAQLVRARVSAAGVAATLRHVLLKGY